MTIIVRLAVLAVFVVATPFSARAADKSYDDTVFGTWDGLRSSLHDDTPGDALRVRRKARQVVIPPRR